MRLALTLDMVEVRQAIAEHAEKQLGHPVDARNVALVWSSDRENQDVVGASVGLPIPFPQPPGR